MGRVTEPVVALRHVEANKQLLFRGRHYKVGELVDVSALPDHKIGQLLAQRLLRPAKDDDPILK